jgi:hypothetical protein
MSSIMLRTQLIYSCYRSAIHWKLNGFSASRPFDKADSRKACPTSRIPMLMDARATVMFRLDQNARLVISRSCTRKSTTEYQSRRNMDNRLSIQLL